MTRVVDGGNGSVSFVDANQEGILRQVLLHAYDNFRTYREHFVACSVSRNDLAGNALIQAFARLGSIDKKTYARLQPESLSAQQARRFVIDPSSGTTGTPILKFTSQADDEAEASSVIAAFRQLGIGEQNRCACLDIGASQIYLFYMTVLQSLGAKNPLFIKVTSDPSRAVQMLKTFDPDVIVSIPSVLKRCQPAMQPHYRDQERGTRKVIYIGEPMEETQRHMLARVLGADCFSFYGTTELGSICMECRAHAGMHIPLTLFVPTLSPWPTGELGCEVAPSRYRGTVAWTSLHIHEQPAIKYAVNDFVEIDLNPCACGSTSPRLVFLERIDETFFLYGITFTYQFFLDVVQSVFVEPIVELEVNVIHQSSSGELPRDSIVLVMNESLKTAEDDVLEALHSVYPISDLVWSNLLKLEVAFVSAELLTRRKGRRLRVMDADNVSAGVPAPERSEAAGT